MEFVHESPSRTNEIRTTFVPKYDLQLSDSNPLVASVSMKQLAEGNRSDSIAELNSLAKGYRQWIHDRIREARSLPDEFKETSVRNIRECRTALFRIGQGIRVLTTHDQAWHAFQLANSAMLEQRARTLWLKSGRTLPKPSTDSSHQWRPFQIAFILLCIRGMVKPDCRDRTIADLLWFPTGGGKTEAYLGLIAFTTFLRRLRNVPNGGGVTVLMRYTLRLLTIQQFERAALLICCCERLRRRNPQLLGESPIRIGLWVGRSATPNSLDEARAPSISFDKE